jgi:hypothetical protein
MFAQVIQGRTSDAQGFRAAIDRWHRELAPGSVGWLGSTEGVTDDGRVIAVVRFESAEAAERNSQRPEQTAWWEETRRMFDGDVVFHDSEDVTVDLQGDPDRAGFVQVMQGRVTDPARGKQLMDKMSSVDMAGLRPDLIGSVSIGEDDGEWTQVMYFTSEEEARAGERKEMPAEAQALMAEMMSISAGPPDFFDLRQPMLESPR